LRRASPPARNALLMSIESTAFYVFAAILLIAGLRVITARNPVHAALFLVLAFIASSVLWLLLRAEFLAITLVLVYVGAVMVLFLFVIMMLDINIDRLREGFWSYLPLGATIGLLLVAEMIFVLSGEPNRMSAPDNTVAADYSNTKELGRLLYSQYLYPLEIAAVILLVAIIAAIALTLRKRKNTKYVDVAEQVAVRREDRVRVVSMPAEPRQK
jgi:NADH-quinone oxidoreductase subunit J